MMELKDIIAECKRLANEFCVEFTLPVRINNRLTRTLGRVCFECGRPYVMEISGPMLKTCTEESIIEVVRHEWAHWYAWKTDGEVHGHDACFKEICKKIGCTHDKSKNKVERLVSTEPISKYTISCGCGQEWHYSRMCDTIRNIEYCSCPTCGGSLTVKQNW
jgi:predicted SprT family Zn-dependent metalloprotease